MSTDPFDPASWEAVVAELHAHEAITVFFTEIEPPAGLDEVDDPLIASELAASAVARRFHAAIGGVHLSWRADGVDAESRLLSPVEQISGEMHVAGFADPLDDSALFTAVEGMRVVYLGERTAVLHRAADDTMHYLFDDEPAIELELDFAGFVDAMRRFRGASAFPTLFSPHTARMVDTATWRRIVELFPDLRAHYAARLAAVGV